MGFSLNDFEVEALLKGKSCVCSWCCGWSLYWFLSWGCVEAEEGWLLQGCKDRLILGVKRSKGFGLRRRGIRRVFG